MSTPTKGTKQAINDLCKIIKSDESSKREQDRATAKVLELFDAYLEKWTTFFSGGKMNMYANDTRRFLYTFANGSIDPVVQRALVVSTLAHLSREDIKQELTCIFLKLLNSYKIKPGVDALGYMVNFFRLKLITWYTKLAHNDHTFSKAIKLPEKNPDAVFDKVLLPPYTPDYARGDDYSIHLSLNVAARLHFLRSLDHAGIREYANDLKQSITKTKTQIDELIAELDEHKDEYFSSLELLLLTLSVQGLTTLEIAEEVDMTMQQVGLELRLINEFLAEEDILL